MYKRHGGVTDERSKGKELVVSSKLMLWHLPADTKANDEKSWFW
jgi:hypothetical protein